MFHTDFLAVQTREDRAAKPSSQRQPTAIAITPRLDTVIVGTAVELSSWPQGAQDTECTMCLIGHVVHFHQTELPYFSYAR
jgi:hypothetical protein